MASESAKIVGENVVLLRKRLGWTQQDLADKCGVARPRIAEIESGNKNPTVDTIDTVASKLGVTVARLFRRYEPQKTAS